MGLVIGYLKAFPLEMGGGLDGKECVRNGGRGRSKHTCAHDGGGQIFDTLVRTH